MKTVNEKAQLLEMKNDLKEEKEILLKERNRKEEIESKQLHESQLLNALLNTSEDAIYFKDTASKFTTVNAKMFLKMGATDMDDMIGKSDFDYFTKEHANQAFQDEQEIVISGKPLVGIVEKETWPDGSITWVSTSKMPIVDDHGRITGIVGISRDITGQKETENELIASEERFRSLILNLSDMILILDDTAVIKYASNSSENVLGFSSNELIDTLASDYIHPDDQADMQREFEKVLRKEYDFNPMQLRCRNKNKGWVYLDIVGNNLIGHPGINAIVITARDVTERRNAEIEAEKILLELERSNKELEQFAYAVSHDLQEPLRKIKSFAELLSHQFGDSLDEKAVKYIEYMVDGSHRMQILIKDLLTYSRLISGSKAFGEVDTGMLIQNTQSNLQLAIIESNATIEIQNLPVIVGDENQLARLFQNLLSNAIKFRGKEDPVIKISAERKKSHWKFTVSDNGIGIEPQYKDRIFEIFQRLHTRVAYPGTGIGLALCKRIVELHGGELHVDSEPGRGASFIFTISTDL